MTPAWGRRAMYTGGAVFGGTVIVLSGYALWSLAVAAGWSGWHALGPPVAFDACALVAGVAWAAGTGKLRQWGVGVTWGLITASAVCNAAAALAEFGLLPQLALVVLFVTVPTLFPIVAGLVTHLVLLTKRHQPTARASPRSSPPTSPATSPTTSPAVSPPDEVKRQREREKKRRQRQRRAAEAAQ